MTLVLAGFATERSGDYRSFFSLVTLCSDPEQTRTELVSPPDSFLVQAWFLCSFHHTRPSCILLSGCSLTGMNSIWLACLATTFSISRSDRNFYRSQGEFFRSVLFFGILTYFLGSVWVNKKLVDAEFDAKLMLADLSVVILWDW
jgi:ABC-type multidrug transport system permease subunit